MAMAAIALMVLLTMSSGARAQASMDREGGSSASVGAKIFDVTLLRTSGALTVVVGAVYLIPASIMTLPSGRSAVREAYDLFVGDAVQYTFRRDLGEDF